MLYNDRLVAVTEDSRGRKIVLIEGMLFRGKRNIDWRAVERRLKAFVGSTYIVASLGHEINIGSDLPDEYTGSRYTAGLMGANAKAKANASAGLPELIEIATGGFFRANAADRHLTLPLRTASLR